MPTYGPTLETSRLILRPPTGDDFEMFADFMSREETARYLGGRLSRPLAWRSWAAIAGSWVLHGFSMFSIVEKASGRWIGRAGPWRPDGWPGTEVGWGIAAEAQRRGYATEAARAAVSWAFDTLGWAEVIHCIEPTNLPSIGVARALGSTLRRSGVAAPPPITATWDIYGQTREEWRARRG